MTAAIRSTSSYVSAATETSAVVPVPAGVQDGDLLLMAIYLTASTGSITTPGGWTAIYANSEPASSTSSHASLFRRIASSEPASYTITVSSGRATGSMVAITGADTANPIDASSVAVDTTAGLTATAATVTPSATSLMLSWFGGRVLGNGAAAVWAPGIGLTEQVDVASAVGAASSAHVQNLGTNRSTASGRSSLALSPASKTVSVGNTIVVGWGAYDAGVASGVTDNLGNTYSPIEAVSGAQARSGLWSAPVTTGGSITTITVAFGTNANYPWMTAAEFSGLAGSPAVGSGVYQFATAGKWAASKTIPANGMAVGLASSANPDTITAGSASGSPSTSIALSVFWNGDSYMSGALAYAGAGDSQVTAFDGTVYLGGATRNTAGAGGIFSPAVAAVSNSSHEVASEFVGPVATGTRTAVASGASVTTIDWIAYLVVVKSATAGTLIVYSDPADGYIQSFSDVSYADARSGSATSIPGGVSAASATIGQYIGDSGDPDYFPYWYVNEVFLSFDTSGLGAGATVSAAVLRLTSQGDFSTTDFSLQARLRDWGAALTTADYVAGASLSGLTLLAHYATSGGFVAGNGYDFADDALPANVNKTGTTRLLLCSSRTTSGTAPAGNEHVSIRSADYAGTASDPKLTITYTAGGRVPDGPGPTLDALIRKTASGSFAASAVIKRAQTGTFATAAIVKKSSASTIAADAVVRRTTSGVSPLDAVLRREFATSLTTDAIIARSSPGSFAADAIVRRAAQGSGTLDAVVRRTSQASLTTDAIIARTSTGTFGAGSVVRRSASSSLSADAIVRFARLASLTTEAIVLRTQAGAFGLSAYLITVPAGSFSLSASIFGTVTRTFGASAYIQVAGFGSATLDAIFFGPRAGTFGVSAIALVGRSGTFSVSAIARRTQSGSLSSDAIVLRNQAGSHQADAVIRRQQTAAFAAAAVIASTRTSGYSISAVVLSPRTATFTASALFLRPGAGSALADAVIFGTQTRSLALSAYVQVSGASTATLDAVIQRTDQGSASLSAYLAKTTSGTFGASAVLLASRQLSVSLSAVALQTRVQQLVLDGIVKRTKQGQLDVSAAIRRVHVAPVTFDSIFLATLPRSATADAVIRSTSTNTFTVSAYIQQSSVGVFGASAVVLSTRTTAVAADAVLRREFVHSFAGSAVVSATSTNAITFDGVLRRTASSSFGLSAFFSKHVFGLSAYIVVAYYPPAFIDSETRTAEYVASTRTVAYAALGTTVTYTARARTAAFASDTTSAEYVSRTRGGSG